MWSYHRNGKALIRFIAYSGAPLEGQFRFEDELQIFSLPRDTSQVTRVFADHPFVIEYSFEEMDADELRALLSPGQEEVSDKNWDRFNQSEHHWSKQQEIISILSVLTRHLISKENPRKHWVPRTEEDTQTVRYDPPKYYKEGFESLGEWFSEPSLPELPVIEGDKYYNQIVGIGDPFKLSNSTNTLLHKYFELGVDEKRAFLSACALFSQAIKTWSISQSLTYIGIVSSLEALIDFERRGIKINRCTNPECNQPIYKVTKGFVDFVSKYGLNDEKIAKGIYARRSGIGHKGKLLSGDVAGEVFAPHDETGDWWELMQLSRTARICLVNWLLKRGVS